MTEARRVNLNARIDAALLKRLRVEAAKREMKIQEAVEAAIRLWLRGGKP